MKPLLIGSLLAVLGTSVMHAAPISFSTANINNTGLGASVVITPTFDVLNQTLTLLINGLISNPKSVIQGLSTVDFTVTGGLTGSLSSVSGQLIRIADNKAFANISGTPNWQQTSAPNDFFTTTLVGQNKHVLIGAPAIGGYTNSNGSIAGNNGHPAWVREELTLIYTISGLTANTNLNSLILGFGTGPFLVTVDRFIPGSETGVPEPGTAVAMLSGVAALAAWRKFKK